MGYDRFCKQYAAYVARTGVTSRVEHKAGRTIEVDWAGKTMRIVDPVVYGQINVYGVTTKSERHKRSYWTRTADGNGIGGRKAPVPYGS